MTCLRATGKAPFCCSSWRRLHSSSAAGLGERIRFAGRQAARPGAGVLQGLNPHEISAGQRERGAPLSHVTFRKALTVKAAKA